jgi:hypothetical protein
MAIHRAGAMTSSGNVVHEVGMLSRRRGTVVQEAGNCCPGGGALMLSWSSPLGIQDNIAPDRPGATLPR